jgi:hypothetical protein
MFCGSELNRLTFELLAFAGSVTLIGLVTAGFLRFLH